MQVELSELERQTLNRLLRAICLGGDLNVVLESISNESGQSTALHHIMDKTNHPERMDYSKITELKKILDQPLPGGHGSIRTREQQIRRLCREIAG